MMYKETIKYRKNYLLLLILFVTITITIAAFLNHENIKNIIVGTITAFMTFILIKPTLKMFKGSNEISLNSELLTVRTFTPFPGKISSYELKRIRNIKCNRNENSETYISIFEIEFLGFRHHPEASRKYIKNPVTIHFDYENEHIKIGEGFEAFNGDKIVKLIKLENRKKN